MCNWIGIQKPSSLVISRFDAPLKCHLKVSSFNFCVFSYYQLSGDLEVSIDRKFARGEIPSRNRERVVQMLTQLQLPLVEQRFSSNKMANLIKVFSKYLILQLKKIYKYVRENQWGRFSALAIFIFAKFVSKSVFSSEIYVDPALLIQSVTVFAKVAGRFVR